jgi:hypothetical protein
MYVWLFSYLLHGRVIMAKLASKKLVLGGKQFDFILSL